MPPLFGDSIINLGATTTLTGAATGGTWSSGDTTIATIEPHTGVVTGKSVGSTYVSYEIGCIEYYPMKVTWPASTPMLSHGNFELDIYPNPAQNELNIKAPFPITNLSISNLIGKTIYCTECNSGVVNVDVSDLPAGVYFVKINGTEVRKFVKE